MTEVLLGAAYVFFVTSLIASSGTEAIASLFNWRANLLLAGASTMLNDKVTGLASAVYANPLVNPRGQEAEEDRVNLRKGLPSYIDPNAFAIALVSALGLEQATLDALKGIVRGAPAPAARTADGTSPGASEAFAAALSQTELQRIQDLIQQHVAPLRSDRRLSGLLAATILRCDFDLVRVAQSISNWFTQASERIGGVYKRRTQLTGFVFGLVVAVVFDVSPLPPSLADLTRAAPTAASVPAAAPPAPEAAPARGAEDGPPVAAPGGGVPSVSAPRRGVFAFLRDSGALQFAGWVLTALSTLLGAPFWFGILAKVANVRGSGDEPDPATQVPLGLDAAAAAPPAGPPAPAGGTAAA